MVQISNKGKIDLSFMPSLECNLECPFCMYDAGPDKKETLDYDKTKSWFDSIDWRLINSIGFYGGEPSINMDLYQKFINLIPQGVPVFMISNGAWSKDHDQAMEFVSFIIRNDMHLVVSGTPYHKKYQNQALLRRLKNIGGDCITLKGDDTIHPMGRASTETWTCGNKCQAFEVPIRLAVKPSGDIVFQNCDGVYPVIQNYRESFESIIDRTLDTIASCCGRNVI